MNDLNVAKVISELGKGGFGVVHEVLASDGLLYARKTYQINQVFNLTPAIDTQLRKRFEREANLQSGVNHPNIVPIIQKSLSSNPPYFLMPLAQSSLEKDLENDRHLGGKFLSVINDIIAGLEELHALKIYHRDLKPANVLRFSPPLYAKDFYAIGDFGLIALKHTQVSQLTTVGMKMSSDRYTAPEITQDLSMASAQSDIYSLGCIIHDVIGTQSRVPCAEIKESGDYAALLLSCTRSDPSRRFKSVSDLREALLAIATVSGVPTSVGAINLQSILKGPAPLTADEWSHVADFIEDNKSSHDAVLLLKLISHEKIMQLTAMDQRTIKRIGLCYADFIRHNSFDFGDCDGLATRLTQFLATPDEELQSECLLALLFMGTSHNRWYVERLFANYVGNMLPDTLSRRLAVEFRADREKILRAVVHLEESISISRDTFHPNLRAALG